jgi:hypothetical protein
MHDCLFEHQQALDDTHLKDYAVALGLDVFRFSREMGQHVYETRIREDPP